jgi:hypothetical protein
MCNYCCDTDVNPDPERLIGLAHCWLSERGLLDSSRFMESWSDGKEGPTMHRQHKGGSEGRATAMLELVASAAGLAT